MCGICGKVNLTGGRMAVGPPVDEALLRRMCASLRHRGPDGEGLYLRGAVGLGHRRLSIIDLESGDQPMSNEDGTIWIVFNGEIYNYLDLRAELISLGHVFTTRSDTEVIIHAYETWGPECCTHLRGMYAYAIWDEKARRLILTRDRLGKKPLLYTRTSDSFLFASELRALLLDEAVQRQVDLEAIAIYLVRTYVPAPQTAFKGIYKVPAAHYLILAEDNSGRITLQIRRYWQLTFDTKLPGGNHAVEEELQEQLWELLCESTRLRLMSEVPLGAFLSGGIDSSAVVGLMSHLTGETVKTFSISFKEAGYDESAYARRVAELFHTDHHEFTIQPRAMEVLPELVWHYGEPFADASAVPTYYVSRLTRQHVTVALSGDAGDETFAGYEHYRVLKALAVYRKILGALPGEVLRLNLLPAVFGGLARLPGLGSQMRRLRVLAQRGALPVERAYYFRSAAFTPEMSAELWQPTLLGMENLNPEVLLAPRLKAMLASFQDAHPLECWQYLDLLHYLPDDILVKVDIASMANSLEVRSPFLDHKIVEFAATLPVEMKLRGNFWHPTTKYILKKTLERLLPAEILYRPKHGFSVPLDEWFRGELRGLALQVLLDPRTLGRGYFRPQQVERLLHEHTSRQFDHGDRLWVLLNLELWHRTYVDEVRECPLTL